MALSFLVALRYVDATVPGLDVPLFSPPTGQTVVILGLLCFERDLRSVWFILVINLLITLAWQVRAEWAGLAVGTSSGVGRPAALGRVVAIAMGGLAVLGLLAAADVNLVGRAGDSVSLSENIGRIIAPFDLQLAMEFNPNAKYHAGTVEWRELWWKEIWRSVHRRRCSKRSGTAMASTCSAWHRPEVRAGQAEVSARPTASSTSRSATRAGSGSPCSASCNWRSSACLWRSFGRLDRRRGWFLAHGDVRFSFEEGFETPYKAIPFYLMFGMAMAPVLQARAQAAFDELTTAVGRRAASSAVSGLQGYDTR